MSFFICCNSNSNNENEKETINFDKIPKNEFICPFCDEIPEILKVHYENGKIEFKCKKYGIKEIYVLDYFSSIEKSEYNYLNFSCQEKKCLKTSRDIDDKYFYCSDCKKIICDNCKTSDYHKDHDTFNIDKKKKRCQEHLNENAFYFCNECQECVCNQASIRHKDHKIVSSISVKNLKNKEILDFRKIIKEKNTDLTRQIKLNELILNTCGTFQDNYYHMESVINLGKSIEKESSRDSKDKDCILQDLYNSYKFKKDFINEKFKRKKTFFLSHKDSYLHLKSSDLNKDDLKLISLIKFNQLKEIDISNNDLESIDALNYMNLPFLESINLNYNKIKNIEPIVNFNSKKLKEILLINNQLKLNDIYVLCEIDCKDFEILRVEKNLLEKEDENSEEFKKIKKKFGGNLFTYKEYSLKEFQKEYEKKEEIKENSFLVDLSDIKRGDNMLKKFYLGVTFYKDPNKIQNR